MFFFFSCFRLPKLGSSLTAAQSFTLLFQRKVRISVEETDKYPSQSQIHELKFNSVKFSYPTRSQLTILNDLKLTLKSGQSIALVGKNKNKISFSFHNCSLSI